MSFRYWFFYTIFKCFGRSVFSLDVVDKEKLIEEGPVLIVANHQSFVDPPMIGVCYEEGIYFFARKSLFNGFLKYFLPFCQAIPVDQTRPDPRSMKAVIALLNTGKRVLVFPEGSRTPDGTIKRGMGGVGMMLAYAKNIPVQPLRIEGAYDCLPMGSSKMRALPITVYVGDPIQFTPEELNSKGKEAYQHLADKVMASIAALGPKDLPPPTAY